MTTCTCRRGADSCIGVVVYDEYESLEERIDRHIKENIESARRKLVRKKLLLLPRR